MFGPFQRNQRHHTLHQRRNRRQISLLLTMTCLLLVGCASAPRTNIDGPQPSAVAGAANVPAPTAVAASPTAVAPTVQASPSPSPQATIEVPPVVVAPESSAPPEPSASAASEPAASATGESATPTAEIVASSDVASTPLIQPTIPILPSPTLPALDENARAERFDQVWQKVEDDYLYRDFGGQDWQAIRDEYRPQALEASSSEAFYAVIKQMIQRLEDRHSRYLTPQEAQQQKAVTGGTEAAYVGIGTLDTNGLVLGVFSGSPAELAGLKRRDRIVAIDGQPWGTVGTSLDGPEGSTVVLTINTPGGGEHEVSIVRNAIVAKLLPDAYRLPGTNTGYLVIQWLWSEDMGVEVATALRGLLDEGPLDGLIIDLRANRGGWRSVLEQSLASFVEGETGKFFRSDEEYPLTITPNDVYPRLADTPLVVLIDDDTQSYAEVIAASLQARGRATVIGTQSPGNTETIFGYDFADGSRLWLAQEGFRLPSGENLEGRGVIPDETVDVDWTTYSDGDDPQLLKALEVLSSAEVVR